jgi:glycosyltransferase involved in cell wall biosynthesis
MCGFDPTPARFKLLRGARALLVLSRFENGPLMVLEALAHGTPVIGWDVGGLSEIAEPPLINLVPHGDREALLGMIDAVLDRPPPRHLFASAAARLRSEYLQGATSILRTLTAADERIRVARPDRPRGRLVDLGQGIPLGRLAFE